jgi:hypothetical protein
MPKPPRLVPLAVAAAALALAGATAPAADAGLLAPSAVDCPAESLSQPFAPWLDPASYTLAPGGSFEPGAPGWDRSRADRVSGNEPFYVRSAADTTALRIASGGSATSPTACVGLSHPTIRFFARNVGSPLGTLRVDVLFHGPGGLPASAPVGVVAGTGRWAPSLPMPIVANLLPLLPDERTPVALRFTPVGLAAAYEIDDVYIDPYSKR